MSVSNSDLTRINKSAKNASVALFTSIAMGVLSFLERTQFNHVYIDDYLGMFSLFNNIINILSCSELGITTAVAYALYKPVALNDEDQIASIIGYMKKVYFFIGAFITFGGLLLIPFLPLLISTDIPYSMVSVYFMLFVIKTAFSYWLTASTIILTVNQEQYIQTFIQNMTWCVQYALLMLITALTANFLYYSIMMLVCSVFCSLQLRRTSRKRYPVIKRKTATKISKESKHHIISNMKGLMITRIGSVIVNSTDSILISVMVSTAFLGKYSNYQMIIAGISGVLAIIPNAITASIGNMGVVESKRKVARSFETINLAHYFCYSITTVVLVCISSPIVSTFFGKDKTIPLLSVIIVCINFYIKSLRFMTTSYKSSLGLYWYDRKRPLFESVANILYSIILGKFFGFNGILAGTILTNITVNLWYEPLIIYHYGFQRSAFWYYFSTLGRMVLASIMLALSIFATSFIPTRGLGAIIQRGTIAALISLLILFIFYRKNDDAMAIVNTMKVAILSKLKKTSTSK